ncbi:hypothetical protein VNO80_27069 [Phaseolus coccineus]|uniref:Uncharacterized protein n=1 Tax=Phaseolus coccineus TaxID=3886 RepID=A0AAN9LGN7_PHACN
MSWRKMSIWGLVDCLLGNADEPVVYPPDVPPPYKAYRDEDWQDNDGALNTISMTHPLLPIEHPNCLVEKESNCKPLQPGICIVVICPFEALNLELWQMCVVEIVLSLVEIVGIDNWFVVFAYWLHSVVLILLHATIVYPAVTGGTHFS